MNELFALLFAGSILGFGIGVGLWWFNFFIVLCGNLGEWVGSKIYNKKKEKCS